MRPGGLVLAFSIFFAGVAGAQEDYSIDLKFGSSSLKTVFGEVFSQFVDDGEDSLGLSLGRAFGPWLGLELGYRELGTFVGRGSACNDAAEACFAVVVPVEAKLDVWTGYLVPQWALSRFTLFGKVGASHFDAEVREVLNGGGARLIDEFSEVELAWGGGVRFRLADRLDLIAEYETFDLDVETASVGLGWLF